MVVGYHLIFGAYGFWLPNDPRGSWSTEVLANHLKPFGEATKVTIRNSLAGRPHDQRIRAQAKRCLKYPAVLFTGLQARAIGRGIARISKELQVQVPACAILPNHVHLVTGRHDFCAEKLIGVFKRAASSQLLDEKIHPFQGVVGARGRPPTPWAGQGWHVFINSVEQMQNAIGYVERNPIKAGLPAQCWSFVTPPKLSPGRRDAGA